MKYLVLLALVAAVSAKSILEELQVSEDWDTFKARFGKSYPTEEEETRRFSIFKEEVSFGSDSLLPGWQPDVR